MNNIRNKLINGKNVENIVNRHLKSPVSINNVSCFRQAFMHKSFLIKDSFEDEEDQVCMFQEVKDFGSNERLEFLGDSVLNLVTAEYLFEKYKNKDEGFLTKLRTKLVRNTQLSFLGEKLGFNEWLLISSHVEKITGRTNPRLIEDVFESFLAALYKTCGFYVCREFIFSCYDSFIDLDYLTSNNDNYKDILLRFFQINDWKHPLYETISQSGTNNNREFLTCVVIDEDLVKDSIFYRDMTNMNISIKQKFKIENKKFYISVGSGKTKKESEQQVSKNLLKMLNVPNNF